MTVLLVLLLLSVKTLEGSYKIQWFSDSNLGLPRTASFFEVASGCQCSSQGQLPRGFSSPCDQAWTGDRASVAEFLGSIW